MADSDREIGQWFILTWHRPHASREKIVRFMGITPREAAEYERAVHARVTVPSIAEAKAKYPELFA